jgi:short-subunit dehydrogenase
MKPGLSMGPRPRTQLPLMKFECNERRHLPIERMEETISMQTNRRDFIQASADLLTGFLPQVDILVNSLGIFEPKPFTEIPDVDRLRFFEINVLRGVRLKRFYATHVFECQMQQQEAENEQGEI